MELEREEMSREISELVLPVQGGQSFFSSFLPAMQGRVLMRCA